MLSSGCQFLVYEGAEMMPGGGIIYFVIFRDN